MYSSKKILAVIPARGGSKGIKDKNVTSLCGKPLIAYTIEAALKSKYIDVVIVSTDSEKIAETARIKRLLSRKRFEKNSGSVMELFFAV